MSPFLDNSLIIYLDELINLQQQNNISVKDSIELDDKVWVKYKDSYDNLLLNVNVSVAAAITA